MFSQAPLSLSSKCPLADHRWQNNSDHDYGQFVDRHTVNREKDQVQLYEIFLRTRSVTKKQMNKCTAEIYG